MLTPDEVLGHIESRDFQRVPTPLSAMSGTTKPVEVVQAKTAWLLSDLARQLLACREALRHYDKWAGYLKNLAFAQAGSTQHDAGRIARACLPEYENDEENKNGNQ